MTFIIADAGVNHCGRLDYALKLIKRAAEAGVNAVKFQGFSPTELAPADYATRAMLKGLWLSPEEMTMLAAECDRESVEFMCTPMNATWLDFCVNTLRMKRVKIGSGQNRDLDFVRACGTTGLPVIISNGMADNREFAEAMAALWGAGCSDVTVLACISKYPTPDTSICMSEIARLRDLYPTATVGFSCHARSFWPSVAAVYAGAAVVEKHLKLSDDHVGPDMSSSITPQECDAWVREIRQAEKANEF